MRSESFQFPNPQGLRLSGRLDLPDRGQPDDCAVFAHCFTCHKSFKAAYHLSRALTAQGLGVLRFDFPGLGESEGDLADTTLSSNAADVVCAARYLDERGRRPALLIGHSLGGAAVLLAAASLPSTRAVVTIGAPAEPRELLAAFGDARATAEARGEAEVDLGERVVRLKRAYFDDLAAVRMAEALRDLGKPLLILHAPEDEVTGFEHAERIFRAARNPKSLVALDGADHLLSLPADSARAGAVIAAWAGRYLASRVPEAPQVDDAEGRVRARAGSSGFRTEITAAGHGLVADEPLAEGGTNAGPSPYDLLLAALGACTAMTLRMYADRKGWPLEAVGVELGLDEIHAEECARCETRVGKIDRIRRVIELSGDLTAEQRERLRQIADRCPVHQTLTSEILIETSVGKP